MPNIDIEDAVESVRGALTGLHPRGRRWLNFLRSLPLDPDALPQPLSAPGDNDFIICGAPRTGTTLLSAMLFQPPSVVTVMEPWNGMRIVPAELFSSIRQSLMNKHALEYGKLDVEALLSRGTVNRVPEGTSRPTLSLEPNFQLGVKWPAFWRYLDLLPATRFLVCVRHPHEVIASFKKEGGRLRLGLEYATSFNRRVNDELRGATWSPAVRRVLLYDHINSCIARHADRANVFLVRYERWFEDPDALLREIGEFLGAEVSRPHARIRPPRSGSYLAETDRDLIRKYCPAASALGYDLHPIL